MYHNALVRWMTMLDWRAEGVMSMMEKQERTLDDQFHDVSIAFAEAHDFTEFCYTRLDGKLTGVANDLGILTAEVRVLDTKVSTLDAKVTSLDAKVTSLEKKVGGLDTRLGSLEVKVTDLDTKVTALGTTMDRRFTRNELLLTEVLNEVKVLVATAPAA